MFSHNMWATVWEPLKFSSHKRAAAERERESAKKNVCQTRITESKRNSKRSYTWEYSHVYSGVVCREWEKESGKHRAMIMRTFSIAFKFSLFSVFRPFVPEYTQRIQLACVCMCVRGGVSSSLNTNTNAELL